MQSVMVRIMGVSSRMIGIWSILWLKVIMLGETTPVVAFREIGASRDIGKWPRLWYQRVASESDMRKWRQAVAPEGRVRNGRQCFSML